MTDDIQHSGSRWEPSPGGDGPGFAAAPSTPSVAGPYAATATALPSTAAADGNPERPGPAGKGLMAAIAAGFLVIGGVGGFAVGHAAAGNGAAGTSSVQGGLPGSGGPDGSGEFPGRFDPDGDHGGRVEGGQIPLPNGAAPGDGSATGGTGSGTGTAPGGTGGSTTGGNDDGPTT